MLCYEYQLGRGQDFVELACRINAVQQRHGNIQQDYLRLQPLSFGKKGLTVAATYGQRKFSGKRNPNIRPRPIAMSE